MLPIKAPDTIFTKSELKLDQIYLMDCLDLMHSIKDNSIDLIFADPPYNLSKSNFIVKSPISGGKDITTNKGYWDNVGNEAHEEFSHQWIDEAYRILKDGGSIWVAGTYHNIYTIGHIITQTGFEILNEILWHKTDATPNFSRTRFVADHENFIWARKGKKHIFNYSLMTTLNNGKQMRSLWSRGKTAGGKRIHPTQKPLWLVERVILSTSKEGDIVMDPFMGSGTTAVAAQKLNRHFVGSELDPTYFQQSVTRLKNSELCLITP